MILHKLFQNSALGGNCFIIFPERSDVFNEDIEFMTPFSLYAMGRVTLFRFNKCIKQDLETSFLSIKEDIDIVSKKVYV